MPNCGKSGREVEPGAIARNRQGASPPRAFSAPETVFLRERQDPAAIGESLTAGKSPPPGASHRVPAGILQPVQAAGRFAGRLNYL